MRPIVQLYLSVTDFLMGQQTMKHEKMINENTRLLDNPVCVDFGNEKSFKNDIRGNYEYYAASPLWIKIRLILFWIFWGALVAVIILSVFMYFCLVPSQCSNHPENSI